MSLYLKPWRCLDAYGQVRSATCGAIRSTLSWLISFPPAQITHTPLRFLSTSPPPPSLALWINSLNIYLNIPHYNLCTPPWELILLPESFFSWSLDFCLLLEVLLQTKRHPLRLCKSVSSSILLHSWFLNYVTLSPVVVLLLQLTSLSRFCLRSYWRNLFVIYFPCSNI